MKKEIFDYLQKLKEEISLAKDDKDKQEKLFWIMEAARNYSGEDKLISSLQIAEKLKTAPPEKKIMSGFGKLDEILGGFRHKQLVVISAPTKQGKTSLCIDFTSRMRAENPTWLPFEEGAPELIQKFLDRGEMPPLFFTPEFMTGNTLTWVEKKIIEAKAKFGSSVVFIDHLHFIVDFGENMSIQIGRTMRELKRIAKAWDVVIFLIAHLKKTEMSQQPSLEDLRDSSFIAQEADTVLMLWRETKKENGEVIITNNANLSVQANRRTGSTGNVKLIYDKGKYLERDWIRDDPELDSKKW